jgi:spore germination cell wall hydrolase CwlJ-like protein
MGDLRGGAYDDEGYRPRPRPDPAPLLAWLDGRALGQFAPGQHAWVRNPLPASVHNAKQQKCLAEGIYFEARSESEDGQAAVAQVILNRVRNPAYPDTICGVVYQNKNMHGACQFSFACDGIADRVRSKRAWRAAQRIAEDVTDGKIWLDDVGDSTHYHANYVRPRWGKHMIKADRIGAHIFYRTRFGGWS